MEKKAPTSRQCSSMPSSRHPSTEDLRFTAVVNSKSTPHTPIQSQSSSLIDISQHASMNQGNLIFIKIKIFILIKIFFIYFLKMHLIHSINL